MPRQSNGTYLLPPNTAAVTTQRISSVNWNTDLADLGTEMGNSVDRLGRGTLLAPLDFGGFAARNAADPSLDTDLVTRKYLSQQLAAQAFGQPAGRLTLFSGQPYSVNTIFGAGTVYYTPAIGNIVPLWSSTLNTFVNTVFTEVSQSTTDATKSPAAVSPNKNYDVYAWNDAGTFRATRGPAWATDTSRGTGAGTAEINVVNGIVVNKNAITNGPAAQSGTYLGTIRSNASSKIDFVKTTFAAGGQICLMSLWNLYNRRYITIIEQDSQASWTNSSTTIRAANGSNNNRIYVLCGRAQSTMWASYQVNATIDLPNTAYALIGIALNTTIAADSLSMIGTSASLIADLNVTHSYDTQLGWNFVSAVEASQNTTTFVGNGNYGQRMALKLVTDM